MDLNIRKYIYAFLAFVCVMLSSVSCIFDEYDDVDPSDSGSLQFRIISSVDTKISYPSEYETIFTPEDAVGCVIASKNGEDYTFVENIEWTYKQGDNSGVLMLAANGGKIQAVSDQEKAEQGYVELTDQNMNYAFFFYYPYSDSVNSLSHVVSASTDQSNADALYSSDFIWTNYVLDQRTKTENITSSNANYPVNLTFEKKMAVIDIHCDGDASNTVTSPKIQIGTSGTSIGSNTIYTQSGFNLSTGSYDFTSNTAVFPNNQTGLLTPYLWSEEDTEKIYRLNVVPQTFRDWSLVVTLNSSVMAPIPLEDKLTQLEEGKLYILHIAPAGNGSVEIVDWDSGAFGDLVPEDEVEVVGPHVTRIDNASRTNANLSATEIIARPGEQITITGQNLNLIGKLIIHGVEFGVAATDEGKKITFTFPEFTDVDDWIDGDIEMLTGTEYADVAVGTKLTAGTYVLPTPKVAEVIREGVNITLKGTDLDLATSGFGGSVVRGETVVDVELVDGDLKLGLASCDDQIELRTSYTDTEADDYVANTVPLNYTPECTELQPATVSPGDQLVLVGKNLDLVNCVVYEDGGPDDIVYARGTPYLSGTGETLTVMVPPGSKTGAIRLRTCFYSNVNTPSLTVTEIPGEETVIWNYVSPYHNPQTDEDKNNFQNHQREQEGKEHTVTHEADYDLQPSTSANSTETAHKFDWSTVKAGDILVVCVDRNENWNDWQYVVKSGGSVLNQSASNTTGIRITLTAEIISDITENGLIISMPGYSDASTCRVDKIAVWKQPLVPAITEITRTESEMIITGTNFDYVETLSLNGCALTKDTHYTINSEDQITIDLNSDFDNQYKKLKGNVVLNGSVQKDYDHEPEATISDDTSKLVGETITLNGTNLDLVENVVFKTGSGTVNGTISTKTQTQIVVVIPGDAVAGDVTLDCVDPANTQVVVGLAKITRVTSVEGFKPGSTTTVHGTYLDRIAYATVPGPDGSTLKIDNLAVSGNDRTFTLPETTCDGVMKFYSSSDVLISQGDFQTTKPSNISFANSTVPVGSQLTINGNDLDLVKSITFGGDKTVSDFTNNDTNQIVVTVPEGAETGTLKLNLANGTYVETPTLTVADVVLDPPTISGHRREGSDIIFTGTGLDLVDAVYVNDGSVGFTLVSATEIKVAGTVAGFTGKIKVESENGESDIYPYDFTPVITSVADEYGNTITSMDPGQTIRVYGNNLDLANLLKFNSSGQYVRIDNLGNPSIEYVTVTVPAGATGSTSIQLRDVMGGDQGSLGGLTVNALDGTEETVWNGSNVVYSDWNSVNVGDYVIVYVNPSNNSSDWSFQLNGNTYTNSTGVMIQLDQTSLNYLRNNGGFQIGNISTNNCQVSRVTVLKQQAAGGLELVFDKYSPNPVQAGHELVIYISNSDYIASVLFSGCSEYVIGRSESNREYKVTVPNEAVTGRVTLKLTDGSTMELPDLTITGSVVTPSINSISRVGWEQLIIEGTNFSDATEVTLNGQSLVLDTHYDRDGNKITIYQDRLEPSSNIISGSVTLDGTVTESYDFTPTVTSFDKTEVAVGETITITGTNLDLVNKVIFTGGAYCEVTPGETLTFTVPQEAQTGQITLSCMDGGPTTVTPGQTITITSSGGGNQGGSETTISDITRTGTTLYISGENLSEVQSVAIANNNLQTHQWSLLNGQIKIDTFNYYGFEGDVVLTTKTSSVVRGSYNYKPTVETISDPVIVGQEIIITGTDLDLVDKVVFDNNWGNQSYVSKSGTSTINDIKVTVPSEAKSSELKFECVGQKLINTGRNIEVRQLPTVTSVSSKYVLAGDNLTIYGSDLDLVEYAQIGTGDELNVTKVSSSEISVTIPAGTQSGELRLKVSETIVIESAQNINIAKDRVYNEKVEIAPNGTIEIAGFDVSGATKIVFAIIRSQASQGSIIVNSGDSPVKTFTYGWVGSEIVEFGEIDVSGLSSEVIDNIKEKGLTLSLDTKNYYYGSFCLDSIYIL